MAFIGNTPDQQAFTPAVDFFNGDGSTVAFTLSKPVASVAQVQAVISNVPQNPGSAFTVSGNTITFTSAPPSGTSNIYVYYTSPITQVIAPGQGTVTTTSLSQGGPSWDTSGNVTLTGNITLNNGAADGAQLTLSSSGYSNWNIDNYSGRFRWYYNATEYMTLDASGNLGVGTTSPSSRLHVSGSNGPLRISGSGYVVNPTEFTLGMYTSTIGYLQVPGTNGRIDIWDGGTGAAVIFNTYGVGLSGTPPTSGSGITFPATQVASSNANTLDDYEEGTWTPALTASSSGSPTINSYSASYVKVGRLVQIVLNMSVTKSTAAGYMAITGLPFTVESGYYPQSAMLTDLCSSQYSNPVVQFASNGTSCYPIVNNGSTTTHDQIQWSQWSSTQFTFRLTTTYRSAS